MSDGRWQRLPPLSREEYAALKSSIEEAGVLVPVERDMAGDVLDGHHRLRALNELRADGHVLPDAPAIVRSPIGKSATMKRSYHIFTEGDDGQPRGGAAPPGAGGCRTGARGGQASLDLYPRRGGAARPGTR